MAARTWNPIPGETFDRLTIEDTNVGENEYEYRAVFKNAAGEATSEAATLTVHAPPLVTEQPVGTTVEVGQNVTFEVAASGFPTPTVQWEVSSNGGATFSAVEGATSDQLTIADTKVSESGDEYRAVFTNVAGKATSGVATLTVATTHYSAVAWGQNLFRQLGNGSANASSDVPVTVSGLKFVTAVAAGGLHSLALLANGTAVAWGDNEFGQLGDGSTAIASVPVAVSGLTGVKAIAAGENHSLALLANGTVMAWGDNESGQLGDGTHQESEVPVAVKGLTGVKAIAAGGNHSLALMSNGSVMAWGDNEAGELGQRRHEIERRAGGGQRTQPCVSDRRRRRIQPRAAQQRNRRGLGRQRIGPDWHRHRRKGRRRRAAKRRADRGGRADRRHSDRGRL